MPRKPFLGGRNHLALTVFLFLIIATLGILLGSGKAELNLRWQEEEPRPSGEKPREEKNSAQGSPQLVPLEPPAADLLEAVGANFAVSYELRGTHAVWQCLEETSVIDEPGRLHTDRSLLNPGDRLTILAFRLPARDPQSGQEVIGYVGVLRDDRGLRSTNWVRLPSVQFADGPLLSTTLTGSSFTQSRVAGHAGETVTLCQFGRVERSGRAAVREQELYEAQLVPCARGMQNRTVRWTIRLLFVDDEWTMARDEVRQFLNANEVLKKTREEDIAQLGKQAAERPADARLPFQLAWLWLSLPGDSKAHAVRALEQAERARAALDSAENEETLAACHAQLGDYPKALLAEEKALRHPSLYVQYTRAQVEYAYQRLVAYREGRVAALARDLEDPAGPVRREAAVALARLRAEAVAAVPALEKRLADDEAAVRAATTEALEAIAPLEQLAQRLQDSRQSIEARRQACRDLARRFWYDPRARQALESAQGDSVLAVEATGALEALRKRLRTSSEHRGTVRQVVFSPDGRQLAAVSEAPEPGHPEKWATEVKIWEWAADRPPQVHLLPGRIDALGFGADGRTFLTSGDDGVRTWETTTGKELAAHPGPPHALFAPGGKTAASNNVLWDLQTDRRRTLEVNHKADSCTCYGEAFSPDGSTLAAAVSLVNELPPQVLFWDVASGKALPELRERRTVNGLAFAPAGDRVVTVNQDGDAKVWERRPQGDWIYRETLLDYRGRVDRVAWSGDGRTLALALRERDPNGPPREGELVLWDAQTSQEVTRLPWHRGLVVSLAFSPDGRTLASGGVDRTARVWDVADIVQGRRPTGPGGGE